MKFLITAKFTGKFLLPIFASAALLFSQVLAPLWDMFTLPSPEVSEAAPSQPQVVEADQTSSFAETLPVKLERQTALHPFANPAGCSISTPEPFTPEQMLANVQNALGSEYDLAERRQLYIWNEEQGTMLDVTNEPFVYEFVFNEFKHPHTYRGDKVATIFMTHGFVIWFREYDGNFRLMALPMIRDVFESAWGSYVSSYWQMNGAPNDSMIYPVMKKLPCHWVIDEGFVSNETVSAMFDLNWNVPDYLSAGRQYLAGNCADAYRVSQEKIGYWDASSMCGPLAWTILRDSNGFPYRIGSWTRNANAFTAANPKWNGQPWNTFDPETFTLFHTDEPMNGYDFQAKGNLYTGDIIYSYATTYITPGYFDHIFIVAGVNENNTRLTISNIVRANDCSIEELALYTPGNMATGAIYHDWNGNGAGRTGTSGFDVFRWNWISYHKNGQAMQYTVRWGDTVETIAFDWKVSPESIRSANQFASDAQLIPGQIITLPVPITTSY